MNESSAPGRAALRRTLIALVVLACIGGLVVAAGRTRRGDPQPTISGGDTPIVEQFIPRNGDEVVSQHRVAIDLNVQWTGRLVVHGREIPEAELTRRPELGQIIFEPGEGRQFERLPAGRVCATAIVWPVGQGETEDNSRPINWCFQVS